MIRKSNFESWLGFLNNSGGKREKVIVGNNSKNIGWLFWLGYNKAILSIINKYANFTTFKIKVFS